MKVVHDSPEARRLPSRNRLALFRLIALTRAFALETRPGRRRSLVILDPDQSNFENYTLALLTVVLWCAYLTSVAPYLAPVSPLIVGIALQVPVYITGLLLPKGRQNLRVQSRVLFGLLIAASLWFATRTSYVRFVADAFLLLVAVNAVAAVILLPLRGRMRALEQEWVQC